MFLVIWGFRTRHTNLAMVRLACRNGHVAAHQLVKITRWFTLFFIPLIPVRHRYASVCAQCGTTLPWSKDDAEAMAARAGSVTTTAPANPVAPPLGITSSAAWGGAQAASWPSGTSAPAAAGWDEQPPFPATPQ